MKIRTGRQLMQTSFILRRHKRRVVIQTDMKLTIARSLVIIFNETDDNIKF